MRRSEKYTASKILIKGQFGPPLPLRGICSGLAPSNVTLTRCFHVERKFPIFSNIPITDWIFYVAQSSCKKRRGGVRNIWQRIFFWTATLYLFVWAFYPRNNTWAETWDFHLNRVESLLNNLIIDYLYPAFLAPYLYTIDPHFQRCAIGTHSTIR
jgi:hypothetical protein